MHVVEEFGSEEELHNLWCVFVFYFFFELEVNQVISSHFIYNLLSFCSIFFFFFIFGEGRVMGNYNRNNQKIGRQPK